MPSAIASSSSGVGFFSIASVPLTWKPPIATATPLARKRRAIAMARGNWFVCTPTRQTTPPWPGCGQPRGDAVDRHVDVHLVIGVDLDRDVLAEDPSPAAIGGDRVKASH